MQFPNKSVFRSVALTFPFFHCHPSILPQIFAKFRTSKANPCEEVQVLDEAVSVRSSDAAVMPVTWPSGCLCAEVLVARDARPCSRFGPNEGNLRTRDTPVRNKRSLQFFRGMTGDLSGGGHSSNLRNSTYNPTICSELAESYFKPSWVNREGCCVF